MINFLSASLLSLLITLFGCVYSMQNFEQPENEVVVNRLLQQISKKLELRHKLHGIGTSVSMPRGIVKSLGLDFQVCRILTKDEARKILIDSVEEFLSMVNVDTEIQTYLENHPFSLKNIEIVIFVVSSTGSNVYHPNIGTASIDEGGLQYTTTDEADVFRYKTKVKESYEEALQALNE